MSGPKGRRLGAVSTVEDTTEPEASPATAPQPPRPAASPGTEIAMTTPAPAAPAAPAAIDVQVPAVVPPAGIERPRAEDLVRPRTEDVAREGIHALVPKALKLPRRMANYRYDHGFDARDQIALALDAWLSRQGY